MAKLTEYPQATTFDANDIFIKDGTGGTKKITIEDVVKFIIKYPNANLAPDYSASSTYIKNELVIHDGELYKAKDNIETAEAWNSAHWEKTKISIAISQLDEDVRAELENKANIDGSYIDLTAGASHQLISAVTIEDQVPYNFRTSGGSVDIGDRETDMIVGGTVAWNQIVQNGNFVDTTGWKAYRSDGVDFGTIQATGNVLTYTISVVSPSTALSGVGASVSQTVSIVKGHKYYIAYDIYVEKASECVIRISSSQPLHYKNFAISAGWTKIGAILDIDDFGNRVMYIGVANAVSYGYAVGDTYKIRNVTAFDLTQMFGPAIADYVYSLEQANAGDGVAWFKKLFPKDYYAYDAGTLQSVQTSAHKMVGFNAWDEEWELGNISSDNGTNTSSTNRIRSKNYIRILPNTTYYFKAPSTLGLRWYDANKNFVGANSLSQNQLYETPANAHYLRFVVVDVTSYRGDICINLSWDGERDGEYESYVEHSYALDDSLTLRGVLTLDENNKLRYNGDTYASDGTVTRRYKLVDMGTLAWSTNSTDSVYAHISDRKSGSQLGVCTGFTQVPANTGVTNMAYGEYKLYGTSDSVAVKVEGITFSNASEKLSGIYLIYELDTPTTESADPYTNPQVVDDFGTEEYIDAGVEAGTRDVVIPVGHETLYYPNLRAKLEMAPNSPDGNGDYIVRQSNGQNAYVPLAESLSEPLSRKADVNGEYDELISGSAKQLISSIGVTDTAAYNLRETGGGIEVGTLANDQIVGGTLVWNQLIKNGNFDNGTTNWGGTTGTVAASNNVLTYTCGAAIHSGGRIYQESNIPKLVGHKILFSMYVNPSVATRVSFGTVSASDGIYNVPPVDVSANTWTHVIQVGSVSDSRANSIFIYLNRTSALVKNDTVQFKNVTAFDLTQMFGASVADYVYSLEQSSAGSGVAWFKKLFPNMNDYYAYDAGTLQSVQTSAHVTTGFNLWDEEWEVQGNKVVSKNYIPILPDVTYCLSAQFGNNIGAEVYKDIGDPEDPQFIFYGFGGQRYFTFSQQSLSDYWHISYKVSYIKIRIPNISVYSGGVCLNVSRSGYDGVYKPYQKHEYQLDESLVLLGLPQLTNGKLTYSGDTYSSFGQVTRKYRKIDMGTLNWEYVSGVDYPYFKVNIGGSAYGYPVKTSNKITMICTKYVAIPNIYNGMGGRDCEGSICFDSTGNSSNTMLEVQDSSYTDAATFKAAMSGVYLVYEATSTTSEVAEAFTDPQIVDNLGTEEYVDAGVESGAREVAIPVGHSTLYQADLKSKLEKAPDGPSGGESQYVVYHDADGNNTYVPLIIPKEIPDIPNEAGTYNLRLVVDSHGQYDMTWIPEE